MWRTHRARCKLDNPSRVALSPAEWHCRVRREVTARIGLAFAVTGRYQFRNQSDESKSLSSTRNSPLGRRIWSSPGNPADRTVPKRSNQSRQPHQIARKLSATRKPQTTNPIPLNDLRERCIMNGSPVSAHAQLPLDSTQFGAEFPGPRTAFGVAADAR